MVFGHLSLGLLSRHCTYSLVSITFMPDVRLSCDQLKTEENIISFVPIVVSLFISMLYNLTIISHQILLSLDTSQLTTCIYLTVYVFAVGLK